MKKNTRFLMMYFDICIIYYMQFVNNNNKLSTYCNKVFK